MPTDLTKHMSRSRQLQYIGRQQLINAGLAKREGNDALRKVQLARVGHNDLIVRRYSQEAGLGFDFSAWRRRDALSKISRSRR